MEINNSTHLSHDAYLLSNQQNASARQNVAPLEQVKKEDQESNKNSSEAKALQETQSSKTSTEQSEEVQSTSLFQPVNLIRAQQQNNESGKQSYKVTAQQQQLAHHAEQAITTYNKVENTQYGQELVNRIEAMA